MSTGNILRDFATNLGLGRYPTKYREIAGFANLSYGLTDSLEASLGGRYSRNEQSYSQHPSGIFYGSDVFTVKSDEDVWTYSTDIKWKVAPQTMLYGRIASGFVPGGPNALTPTTADAPLTYRSSTATSYEAGVKSSFLSGKATAELSAFQIDWRKIQITAFIGSFNAVYNAADARSQGIEWHLAVTPIAGLSLDTTGTYTHARLTSDAPASVGALEGDRLPASPRWQAAASAQYERNVLPTWQGFAAVDLRYQGSTFANFQSGSPRQSIPSYSILDVRVGLENSRWSMTAYVKNLLDKRAINYLQNETLLNGAGLQNATLFLPRTIGLSLGASLQ